MLGEGAGFASAADESGAVEDRVGLGGDPATEQFLGQDEVDLVNGQPGGAVVGALGGVSDRAIT